VELQEKLAHLAVIRRRLKRPGECKCKDRPRRPQGQMAARSERNTNVRLFAAIEMSGALGLSLLLLQRLAPRVILGWAPPARAGILRRATGSRGLRRHETRAPGGRLDASGPRPSSGSVAQATPKLAARARVVTFLQQQTCLVTSGGTTIPLLGTMPASCTQTRVPPLASTCSAAPLSCSVTGSPR